MLPSRCQRRLAGRRSRMEGHAAARNLQCQSAILCMFNLPFRSIKIATSIIGQFQWITSVEQAGNCLAHDWPPKRGPKHLKARIACLDALENPILVERARNIFIAAAKESGIYLTEGKRDPPRCRLRGFLWESQMLEMRVDAPPGLPPPRSDGVSKYSINVCGTCCWQLFVFQPRRSSHLSEMAGGEAES